MKYGFYFLFKFKIKVMWLAETNFEKNWHYFFIFWNL